MSELEACQCGGMGAAICVRCDKPRCNAHYFVSVWREITRAGYVGQPKRATGRWLAQQVSGQSLHLDDVADRGPSWATAYANGGAGCIWCRWNAAENRAKSVRQAVGRSSDATTGQAFKPILESWDTLSREELRALGKAIFSRVGPNRLVATVSLSTDDVRVGFRRSTKRAVALETGRQPILWFDQSGCGIIADGTTYAAATGNARSAALVLLSDGENAAVSYIDTLANHTAGWGANDPEKPYFTFTSGFPIEEPNHMRDGNTWPAIRSGLASLGVD